jgi:hypothetical protein
MRRAFAVIAVIALAACAGSSSSAGRIAQCLAILGLPMIYPQSGATGVPDGNFDLYFGFPGNPTQAWGPPVLTAPNAPTVSGGAIAPAPGQPPNSATPPPGDQAFVSHIPPLAASTTYSVSLPGGACGPAELGNFTTQ